MKLSAVRDRLRGALAKLRPARPSARACAMLVLAIGLGAAGYATLRHRAVAFAALQSHPYFKVERVEIHGAGDLVSVAEMRRWLGIREGESLWSTAPGRLRALAENHPMIRSATVRRIFPGTLQIHLRERRPAAITVLDDLYYVDRRGQSFGPLRPQHDRNYPVFTGLSDGGDGQRRWALRRALHLLRRGLDDASGIRISEMHLDPGEGLILYPERPRVPVFLGWRGWENRLRRAERVLLTWIGSSEKLARIDLRFRDQVVVRLREPVEIHAELGATRKLST